MTEFFEFLKTRTATARKYAPAARDYAMFRTLYHAGLRSEETALLEIADAHFACGPFGKLHVRFGKGAHMSGPRPRWVPMLDGLDLVLRWFLADVRPKFPESPVLFADESGGRLHQGTIRNRLRYLMALEGRPAVERFSPHALRRACATHNYERGMDLVAIQQLLGHWTGTELRRLLAERAGMQISAASVSALLTKEPSQIRLSTLIASCTALQCTPDDLFEIDTTPVEHPAAPSRLTEPKKANTRGRSMPPM